MARTGGNPIKMTSLPVSSQTALQELLLAESIINKGMNTVLDAADIDTGALTIAKNVRVRFDKTSRRVGKSIYGDTKPNSNQVIKLVTIRLNDIQRIYLRFTPSTLHYFDGSNWVQVTGTLDGSEVDFIQLGLALDTFFFTNNKQNRVQKIDFSNNTFSDLASDAPFAKTGTSFGERIVLANLGNQLVEQSTIAWSGDRNFTVFDTAIDESAGRSPLVANPKDLSDPINLLIGFTSVMCIFRESSIWLATNTLDATNPFQFYSAVPGFGAVPNTVVIGSGEASGRAFFLDIKKRTVYAWAPGENPEPIGRPIENSLLVNVDNVNTFFSEYVSATDEFILGTKLTGSDTRRLWIFNARTKAWSYDEQEDVSSIAEFAGQLDYTSIDELIGTINGLTGTINGLTDITEAPALLVTGYINGDTLQEDDTVATDNGTPYTSEIRSKEFKQNKLDTIFTQLRFEYIGILSGTFSIEYTKDGGVNWISAKTITYTNSSTKKLATFKKAIKTRRLMWRIIATTGIFDTINYEVIAYGSGESPSS